MRHSLRRAELALLLGALALSPGIAAQAQRKLTIDDLYDPEAKRDFGGSPPSGIVWLSDTHFAWPKLDPKTQLAEWLRVEAASGRSEPFFDAARLQSRLAGLPGVTADEAAKLARRERYEMNGAHTAALLTVADELYLYDFGAGTATRLTFAPGAEEVPSFSPDGALVAFVRGGNLYVVDVATRQERALTTDGGEELLNGKLDWVYQEEVYGRGNYRGYWWSPDSARLAFLQLDEREVPKYTLVDDTPRQPSVETGPYPKAGDPNPRARLAVARVAGGPALFVDLEKYALADFLLVDVVFTPDPLQVAFQVQDREQTWLDLNVAHAATGASRTLFRETTKAWVARLGSPRYLKDGSFLWLSERSGFGHLYHYGEDGSLLGAVTAGRWEARTLHGVDEAKDVAYFSGTERSPIGLDVYGVKLDGSELTRVSQAPGTHQASFNPSLGLYVDSWSDVSTPPQVRVHRADGGLVRLLDANPVPALAEYRLSKPELLQVETRDGFAMEALLIKPPDFDPTRQYPVYQHTYGGPHAPQVADRWGGASYLFHQLLAQKGIVVWVCDNRSASGKGAESAWTSYKRLGEGELRDVEDGVAWLKRQPWVDASRIGISGWSYGGFMVSYALTHSQSFAMGIAGGPVTDWRNYDSIYTERLMLAPQRNPDGYARSAPTAAAGDLHGRLLLIHGAIDDNVHPQNTLQLAYELQKAGKPFRLQLYPKSRHAVSEPLLVKHLRATQLAFIEETLLRGSR